MKFRTSQSRSRNNLRVESPSQCLPLIQPQSTPRCLPSYNKGDIIPPPIKAVDKGKGISSVPPKRLEEKKCFKCHGHGHFQADCPNQRTLSIREVEEIQALEEETSEGEFEEENHT